MSLLRGCLAASWFVSVPLAYLRHLCPSPLWNAGMVLCKGQQGTSAGEETIDGGGGSNETGAQGWASKREVGRKIREKGKEEEGKREESQRRWGGTGGQEW